VCCATRVGHSVTSECKPSCSGKGAIQLCASAAQSECPQGNDCTPGGILSDWNLPSSLASCPSG
jgi:hypothetical protein